MSICHSLILFIFTYKKKTVKSEGQIVKKVVHKLQKYFAPKVQAACKATFGAEKIRNTKATY